MLVVAGVGACGGRSVAVGVHVAVREVGRNRVIRRWHGVGEGGCVLPRDAVALAKSKLKYRQMGRKGNLRAQ